jgi:hypothetical protein
MVSLFFADGTWNETGHAYPLTVGALPVHIK